MRQYLNLLQHVLESGNYKDDRTGVGCYSIFGYQMRFDLQEGFPLVTTKKLHLRSIIYELLWFLKGKSDVSYLNKNGVSIWDEWANADGDLGPIYGHQWRSWPGENGPIDQISYILKEIKDNPNSRRLLVSSWNVSDLNKMALPPCHILFQFYVSDGSLSCLLYQRSGDIFLGVPFNIASYSLLTMMISQVCGLKAYEFIHILGDAHIYQNHIEQAKEQVRRNPYPLPIMEMNPKITSLFDFQYEDFHLKNYKAHPHIEGKVAV